jgi:hypothetical protein
MTTGELIALGLQVVVYAITVTWLIASLKAESQRNREMIDTLKTCMDTYAAEEREDIQATGRRIDQNAKENSDAHGELMRELGRLGGKIDNGKSKG